MGLRLFFSSSSNDSNCRCMGGFNSSSNDRKSQVNSVVFSPSPEPSNYTIIKSQLINNNLIVKIKYNDVTNYEGNKIMVYKSCDLKKLLDQKYIDPHFAKNKKMLSPFARFEPTKDGWEMACKLSKLL